MDALCPGQPTPAAAGGSISICLAIATATAAARATATVTVMGHRVNRGLNLCHNLWLVPGSYYAMVVGHSLIGVGVVGQLAMI